MNKAVVAGLLALPALILLARKKRARYAGKRSALSGLSSSPTPLDTDLPDEKKMLKWSRHERLIGFRNTYRVYPGDVFRHGKPFPLPYSKEPFEEMRYTLEGEDYTFSDYLERQKVVGFLVIKNGRIAHQYYGEGNNETTLWTSRSVGKSVVSTLVGIALKEGKIRSLDDRLTDYKPDLQGTAWQDVTIKQLMQHTSGVEWNEDYDDPSSHFSRLTRFEAGENVYQCVSDLVRGVKRKEGVTPGEVWSYNTGGAWLLGDILERATGQSLAAYLEEKIWIPFGMGRDGVWQSYVQGKHDMGGHGFNATLEDWGRFGLFGLENGTLNDGTRLLPDDWLDEASAWTKAEESVSEKYPEGVYGYQWWNNRIPDEKACAYQDIALFGRDALWALGIFGQLLVVSPKEDLVMVQWSVWDEAEPEESKLEASVMFSSIAKKLRDRADSANGG